MDLLCASFFKCAFNFIYSFILEKKSSSEPCTNPSNENLCFTVQRSSIIREIIATDGGNRSSKVELAVTITSAKNQPPQWERESYEVVIPENTTRDATVLVRLGQTCLSV